MRLIKDGFIVCKNCGQVHDYLTADEYVDFYENRHRIKRKSVHYRKYHILNIINDIAHDNNIQVGYYNREKILRIFRLIDQVIPQVNNFRRRRLITGLPVLQPSHKMGFRSSAAKNCLPGEGRHEGLVPRNDVLTNGFI